MARFVTVLLIIVITGIIVNSDWTKTPTSEKSQTVESLTTHDQLPSDQSKTADIDQARSIGIDSTLIPKERIVETQAKLNLVGDQVFIVGRVLDDSNSPIANVVVATKSGSDSIMTDSNGDYRLPVQVPPEYYLGITFLRAGYQGKRITILQEKMESMTQIELNAVLKATIDSVSVNGTIRNDQGQAIANRRIKLFSRKLGSYYFAQSNAYGDFIFEGVKTGSNDYVLEVVSDLNYLPYKLEKVDVTNNMPPQVIVLQRILFGSISGYVVDHDGIPIPNFSMRINSDAHAVKSVSLSSDQSGYFESDKIPAGTLEITNGTNPFFEITGITLGPTSRQHVLVQIDTGQHLVEGRVNDHNGVPLANTRVTLTGEYDANRTRFKSTRWLNTDDNGYFRFAEVGVGAHNVVVQAKGKKKTETEFPVGKRSTPLQITLKPEIDKL